MAPTNTRQAKLAGKDTRNHELSDSEVSDDGKKEETPKDPLALSPNQLETVSLLVQSAVAAAVAQVLPIARQNSQNAMGFASPGTSAQDQQSPGFSTDSRNDDSQNKGKEEEEVTHDKELDKYEKSLKALLGDAKLTGLEIFDKIGGLLEKALSNPLDEKVVKLKRDEYPRPDNVNNLQVPRTNPIIFKKASTDHQFLDRSLQVTQSFLVGGITDVGRQAEKLLGLRTWASN